MRYVKGNNSLFMIGDQNAGNILTLSLEKFTYNQTAQKNIRLHSRKTQYLLECLEGLNFSQFKVRFSPERMGIYISAPNEPLNESSNINFNNKISIYENLRSKINPTLNLKNDPAHIPGHISIFHEIHGPSFTLISSYKNQILTKARLDLMSDVIDLAIVGIVGTDSDPVSGQLSETTGIILLQKEDCEGIIK